MLFVRQFTISMLFLSLSFATNLKAATNSELPDIGSSVNRYLSVLKEQQFGDKIIRQLRAKAPLLYDPISVEYVKSISFKLVAQNPNAINRRFDFMILKAPSINAFAMPGGYIAIHSALILKAETEDEVAGVLAHEIAHVTQRHLARRFEKSNQLSIPTLLGTLLSIVAATQNTQAGIAGLTAVSATNAQILTNYTRSNEAEADRVGIQTLADAGFDPVGMAGFFEKLLKEYRHYPRPPEYLLTHPFSERRLAEARNRALLLEPVISKPQISFEVIKERIRTFSVEFKDVLDDKWYQRKLSTSSGYKKSAFEHGYALWLSNNNQTEKAISIASKLVKQYPKSIEHSVLLGEVLIKGEHYEQAIKHLNSALAITPLNYPLSLVLAQANLDSGNSAQALMLLLPLAYQHPDDANLFKILSKAQSLEGQIDESHESNGQHLWAIGNLSGALRQFKIALNGRSVDPYFNTRVRARIAAVEEELLEIKGMKSR